MADADQVRASVAEVTALMDGVDDATRRKIPDGTLSVRVPDVDLAFAGRFEDGHLLDVHEVDSVQAGAATLRLTLASDDLLELVAGRLHFGSAWAHGRIKVEAKFRDLLALRSFL
jgi:hypothetical protein